MKGVETPRVPVTLPEQLLVSEMQRLLKAAVARIALEITPRCL